MTFNIALSRGLFTKVSECDFEELTRHRWCYSTNGYAVRNYNIDGKKGIIFMHRQIMNAPKGMEVDHINGDKLDNRRENLRLVTKQQNLLNKAANKKSKSRYKGVGWHGQIKMWRSRIGINGRQIALGCYKSEVEAALAYNEAAKLYFGEFARLNIINQE